MPNISNPSDITGNTIASSEQDIDLQRWLDDGGSVPRGGKDRVIREVLASVSALSSFFDLSETERLNLIILHAFELGSRGIRY